jgi:hypothetical protein
MPLLHRAQLALQGMLGLFVCIHQACSLLNLLSLSSGLLCRNGWGLHSTE